MNRDDGETTTLLRACTHAGRLFENEDSVREMGERFGRKWTRGGAGEEQVSPVSEQESAKQFKLF